MVGVYKTRFSIDSFLYEELLIWQTSQIRKYSKRLTNWWLCSVVQCRMFRNVFISRNVTSEETSFISVEWLQASCSLNVLLRSHSSVISKSIAYFHFAQDTEKTYSSYVEYRKYYGHYTYPGNNSSVKARQNCGVIGNFFLDDTVIRRSK